jgi:hypothetical protein
VDPAGSRHFGAEKTRFARVRPRVAIDLIADRQLAQARLGFSMKALITAIPARLGYGMFGI